MSIGMKRLLQVLVPLLFLGSVIAVWSISKKQIADSAEEMARPVYTGQAVMANLEQTVEAWGNLRSANQVSILPKVAGSVSMVNFEVGDPVEEGQILAEIDRDTYRLDYERAEAARSAATSTWERIDQLYSTGNASRQNWDNAKASYLAADAQASVAKIRYDWTLVTSPTSGVVLMKHANAGSLVSPDAGTPLYTVGSLEDLELEVSLPELWYPSFAVDEMPSAILKADSFPDLFIEGYIKSVAPWVDPATRSFQVVCKVDSPEGWLRPGMLLSAEFIVSSFEEVYTLPASALTSGKGLWEKDSSNDRAHFIELENPQLIDDSLILPTALADKIFVLEGQHFLNEGDLLNSLEGGTRE